MNEYRGVRQSSQNSSLYITLILIFHRFGPVHDSPGFLVNPIITPSFRSSCSFCSLLSSSSVPQSPVVLDSLFIVLVILPISFGREAVVENCLLLKTKVSSTTLMLIEW